VKYQQQDPSSNVDMKPTWNEMAECLPQYNVMSLIRPTSQKTPVGHKYRIVIIHSVELSDSLQVFASMGTCIATEGPICIRGRNLLGRVSATRPHL